MDIRQLKAFVAIAETGTFTAAAARVHVEDADGGALAAGHHVGVGHDVTAPIGHEARSGRRFLGASERSAGRDPGRLHIGTPGASCL